MRTQSRPCGKGGAGGGPLRQPCGLPYKNCANTEADTTVSTPATAMARLLMAPSTSPSSMALAVPMAWAENMNLLDVKEGEEHIIQNIRTDDEEMKAFLFSLGCYSGEPITVISRLKGGCVVSIKDGRYNIDTDLAKAISI